jgi:uncharacterized DUF497 family protein
MEITRCRMSVASREHMETKHGVYQYEVEEAIESLRAGQWRRGYPAGDGTPRYVAAGRTWSGRRLTVVFELEHGSTAKVISAREPAGHKETARHKALRGD